MTSPQPLPPLRWLDASLPRVGTFPPALSAMPVRYGLHVGQIGEDGDVLVLGHHEDRRRVLAAVFADYRVMVGERVNEWDPDLTYGDALEGLRRYWAVFAAPCGDHQPAHRPDPDCRACRATASDPDAEWFLWWDRTPEDPDAFPVTVWSVW